MPRGSALFRFALLVVAAAFCTLSVGGVVTSRDAGMAFSDWPLSNGSINPDGWIRNPDMRSEHGHRIFGAILGALATLLLVWVWRRRPRRGARPLALAAWLAIVGQGILGGFRVLENSPHKALLHGCAGQAVFCALVALAWLLRPGERGEGGGDRTLRGAALSCVLVLYLQVILGAQLRHVRGPLETHLLGAAVVFGSVFWAAGLTWVRHRHDRALARPALALALLFLLQVLLGFASAATLRGQLPGDYTLAQVILPTAHQTTGACLLATSVVLALAAHGRPAPAPARLQEAYA
ncbi:MAG: COX15/CtaA family protein [Planctomycetaceae bacterium]